MNMRLKVYYVYLLLGCLISPHYAQPQRNRQRGINDRPQSVNKFDERCKELRIKHKIRWITNSEYDLIFTYLPLELNMGIVFDSDFVITKFVPHFDSGMSVLESTGHVQIGDKIVEVAGNTVKGKTHTDVLPYFKRKGIPHDGFVVRFSRKSLTKAHLSEVENQRVREEHNKLLKQQKRLQNNSQQIENSRRVHKHNPNKNIGEDVDSVSHLHVYKTASGHHNHMNAVGEPEHVFTVAPADFGLTLSNKTPSRQIVLANPIDGCSSLKNNNIKGNFVLVQRGGCSFASKAKNVEAHGAAAIVNINNQSSLFTPRAGPSVSIGIPVFMLTLEDGNEIRGMQKHSKVFGVFHAGSINDELNDKEKHLEAHLHLYVGLKLHSEIEMIPASFSGRFPPIKLSMISTDPANGCHSLKNAKLLSGAIALVERGGCTFFQKAQLLDRSGAAAMVMINSNDELFVMHADPRDQKSRMAAVIISRIDGEIIRKLPKHAHVQALLHDTDDDEDLHIKPHHEKEREINASRSKVLRNIDELQKAEVKAENDLARAIKIHKDAEIEHNRRELSVTDRPDQNKTKQEYNANDKEDGNSFSKIVIAEASAAAAEAAKRAIASGASSDATAAAAATAMAAVYERHKNGGDEKVPLTLSELRLARKELETKHQQLVRKRRQLVALDQLQRRLDSGEIYLDIPEHQFGKNALRGVEGNGYEYLAGYSGTRVTKIISDSPSLAIPVFDEGVAENKKADSDTLKLYARKFVIVDTDKRCRSLKTLDGRMSSIFEGAIALVYPFRSDDDTHCSLIDQVRYLQDASAGAVVLVGNVQGSKNEEDLPPLPPLLYHAKLDIDPTLGENHKNTKFKVPILSILYTSGIEIERHLRQNSSLVGWVRPQMHTGSRWLDLRKLCDPNQWSDDKELRTSMYRRLHKKFGEESHSHGSSEQRFAIERIWSYINAWYTKKDKNREHAETLVDDREKNLHEGDMFEKRERERLHNALYERTKTKRKHSDDRRDTKRNHDEL